MGDTSTVAEAETDPKPLHTDTDPADWLRVPAAAKKLGMTESTLYRITAERRVPFRRIPGTRTKAFAPEDLTEIAKLSYVAPLGRTA